MEHLNFIAELDKYGISIRTTNVENRIKEVEIPNLFGAPSVVEIKNFQCKYQKGHYSGNTALQDVISEAIDMGPWKHSWHSEIKPENYEKFLEIIQEKIINRVKEIDFLATAMFLLRKEISEVGEGEE